MLTSPVNFGKSVRSIPINQHFPVITNISANQLAFNSLISPSNGPGNMDRFEEDGNGAEETMAGQHEMAGARVGNKICRVCGDRALGYNFNVVSCESCKAFFRRNALKKKEFRCPFNEKCDVTVVSRRFCQKCRLGKCFEVGMKKEWIMSEDERLQKRRRIEDNRQKRRGVETGGKSVTATPESEHNQTSATKSHHDQSQQHVNDGRLLQESDNVTPPMLLGWTNGPSPSNIMDPAHKQCVKEQLTIKLGSSSASPISVSSNFGIIAGHPVGGEKTFHESVKFDPTDGHSYNKALESESENANLLSPYSIDQKTRPAVIVDGWNVPKLERGLFVSPFESFVSNTTVTTPSPGGNTGFTTPIVQQDPQESLITIPKSVLINLINHCHLKQQELANCVPPVLTRACQLYANDGPTSDDELAKCICRCTCGARGCQGIGPTLVDRGIGPDDQQETVDKSECHRVTAVIQQTVDNMETDTSDGGEVTEMEEMKLRELFIANQVMNEGPSCDETMTSGQRTSSTTKSEDADTSVNPVDVIHMTDFCVRRIIKMCKRLNAFKGLCQEDQIALLKGGCTELMILRGVMTFVPEKDSWRPVGWKNSLLSLEVLKTVKGNVYEEHRKYLRSFRAEWRKSDGLMLCLAAITLFNPERPNLVHVDKVKKEQDVYKSLLRRYLAMMYGTDTVASEEAFRELMNRVKYLRTLNDYTATVFLDMNPRDAEPLLIEVFDLK